MVFNDAQYIYLILLLMWLLENWWLVALACLMTLVWTLID
jgi:hypothetical protein